MADIFTSSIVFSKHNAELLHLYLMSIFTNCFFFFFGLSDLLLLPFLGLGEKSMVGVESKNCNSCAGSEIN